MPDLAAWAPSREFWVLVGFHLFIFGMLALDLGVFSRRAHAVSLKEAAAWSAVWVALACGFALCIWQCWHLWRPKEPELGDEKAIEFVTGYLVELSLSVDNLFVFLVIFRYFGVPAPLRHRVLFWGIVGAVFMRATFILVGAAVLHYFHWMTFVFGGFLIYTGYKLARAKETEVDPSRNWLLRLGRRFLPIVDNYESSRFWVRRDGRRWATPLFLVLLVVESTDVLFALDSIPAVFGITKDTFIVYTSNIFAVVGLRALYFLLANILGMFRYLNVGLALVLSFVGLKMIAEPWLAPWLAARGVEQGTVILCSLGVVAGLLGLSVAASVLFPGKPQAPGDAAQPAS